MGRADALNSAMPFKRTSRPGTATLPPTPGRAVRLPYTVELWNLPRTEPERILARAANLTIARAIFITAQGEHLGRRVVLRRGGEVIQESA
jgi:hypothetical protein